MGAIKVWITNAAKVLEGFHNTGVVGTDSSGQVRAKVQATVTVSELDVLSKDVDLIEVGSNHIPSALSSIGTKGQRLF